MARLTLIAAALCYCLSGCDNDPAQGEARAKVTEAPAATEQTEPAPEPAAQQAVRYSFSEDGSKIEFVGAKVTGKHDGSFGKFSGMIDVAGGDPTKGSVDVEIETASVVADEEKLTKHLKSKDFFHIEEFPKARFKSTSVKAGGDGDATHTVTGELDLHGVKKTIEFPATIRVEDGAAEIDASFAINRKDFGIVYPGMPDDLIKDDVLIKLEIRSKKS